MRIGEGNCMATQAEIDAANAELTAYRTARTAILTLGQDAQVNGRRLTRADLGEIHRQIRRLELTVSRMGGLRGQRQVVPL